MTDIVERLRDPSAAYPYQLAIEAAAEIERLRAALIAAQERYERYYVSKFDSAEAAGYRAGLERAAEACIGKVYAWEAERAIRAELSPPVRAGAGKAKEESDGHR